MIPWLFILAVAPAVFWLWWFYRKDRFDPEPRGLVLKIFLLGTLATIPSMVVEGVADWLLSITLSKESLLAIALNTMLVIGPVEEYSTYLVVKRWATRHPAFNEPLDGIIYATAATLGFAALENFLYLAGNGVWLILVRGPFSTLNHVLFSALWGYALGMASVQTDPHEASRLVRNGLILGALGHGFSDLILFIGETETVYSPIVGLLVALVFTIFLYRQVNKNIATSLANSPFQLTMNPGKARSSDSPG